VLYPLHMQMQQLRRLGGRDEVVHALSLHRTKRGVNSGILGEALRLAA
jgi:hypothetical protein